MAKSKRADLVTYFEGEPTDTGMYACRIPLALDGHLCKDVFLMWVNGRWWYPSSDASYRGEVLGWLGPLERLNYEP
jgi:hypothetical protein